MSLVAPDERPQRLWDTLELSHAISSRNLGEGEQHWEAASGPILNRLAGCGEEGLRFIRSLGIKPSVAHELVNRVGHAGRQSLRLIADGQVALTSFRATAKKHGTTGSVGAGLSPLDSIPEDLFERASKLRLRADWDTRSYGKADLLASCNLLVEEVTTSELCDKTVVALRMLDILCRRHSVARMHMAREVEGLIRMGLPRFVWAMTPQSFRLAFIYQTLADVLAMEMTRYNLIDRILRLVLWEADLAARLIQNRARVMATKRRIASYPQEVRLGYMVGFNTMSNDLNRQWRRMRTSSYHKEMTSTVRGSHMQTLLQLVRAGSSKYFRSNRRRVVEMGGLIFIRAALTEGGGHREESLSLDASALLCELAQEPALLLSLIEAQMGTSMLRQLQASAAPTPAVSIPALLGALQSLHYMCLCVYVIAMADSTSDDASVDQQSQDWVQRCLRHGLQGGSEDDRVGGEVEALEEACYCAGVAKAAHAQLVTHQVLDTLVEIAQTTPVTLVLVATTRLLHSIACIDAQAARLVLDRLTQDGCRSFERILAKGLEGGHVQAGCCVTALFLQLCSRLEHRDLLVGRGMVRLVPYCEGEGLSDGVDLDSLVSVCALRCVVGLCQGGERVSYSPLRLTQALSRASVSGLRTELYDELYALAKPGEASMAHAVRRMKRLRLTNLLLAYLVRPVRLPLSVECHGKGAIVLYGMLTEPEVVLAAPDHLRARTAEHLLVMVEEQTAKAFIGDELGGHWQDGGEWLWLGLRAALFTLCRFQQALGATGLQRVWEGANRHNLLPSLRGLLSAALSLEASSGLSVDDASTPVRAPGTRTPVPVPQHVLEAALRVVEHLAPLPSYDCIAEAATECTEDPKEAEDKCQPVLVRLCRIFAQPILELLGSYSCQERPPRGCMAAALAVLARLATTYHSCVFLMEAGVLSTLLALSMRQRHEEGRGKELLLPVTDLPPSLYHVLAALARLPVLRPQLYDAFMRHTLSELSNDLLNDLTKAHLLMLVARLAHEHTSRTGQADDWLLAPDTRVIHSIVSSIKQPGGSSLLLRFWATSAAASLMRDVLKAVPCFVKAGIIPPLVTLAGSAATPHPLLRRSLQALSLIASHPERAFYSELHKTPIRQCLFRVANSKELCRGPPGELPLGHLANEILIVVNRRGAQEEARGSLKEHDQQGAIITTPICPTVHLPVHHVPEPSAHGYLHVGVSACRPLQPQGPSKASQHPSAHRMHTANTKACHKERWQKRYGDLKVQQELLANSASMHESRVAPPVELMPGHLSRPIHPSRPLSSPLGGVRRTYSRRLDTVPESKEKGRLEQEQEPRNYRLLDPVFVSSSDDGPDNPAAMPALSIYQPADRQQFIAESQIQQATRFQGHVHIVLVRGQRALAKDQGQERREPAAMGQDQGRAGA